MPSDQNPGNLRPDLRDGRCQTGVRPRARPDRRLFDGLGGVCHGEGADPPGRSLQGVGGHGRLPFIGPDTLQKQLGLAVEKRQHLALQATIAEGHSCQMVTVQNGMIGRPPLRDGSPGVGCP